MNLRKLRNQLGYSQEDIMKILGCSKQTLIAIEKGRQDINEEYQEKLKRLFRCSTAELYGMDIFKHRLETKEDKEYVIRMLERELIGEENFSLAYRIKKYREERNLSINELSNLSQVSSLQISKIEGLKNENPKLDILKKLAKALEITYEELIGL